MALFELENGRLVPAQFGRDVPNGFTDEVLEAIRAQVLEIVSRPLFPIAWSSEGHADNKACSRLTALDASGQVVAVEVTRRLDADGLIEALSRLSDTAALSWADLARTYPLGPDGFRREWVLFREAMPPSPPNGPRLVLVTSDIAEEVRPALDVLSSSGVEVHQMSLRQMANGRAFLSVEAVGPRFYGHRANTLLETSAVLPALGMTPSSSASKQNVPEVIESGERQSVPTFDSERVSTPAPLAEPPAAEPPVVDHAVETAEAREDKNEVPAKEDVVPPEVEETTPIVALSAKRPVEHPVERPVEMDLPRRAARQAAASAAFTPMPSRRARHESSTDTASIPTGLPSRRSMRSAGTTDRRSARMELGSRTGIPIATRSERHRSIHQTGTAGKDARGLSMIAQSANADVPLYLRSADRTPAGATLTSRGVIVVPSGTYSDPTRALQAEGVWGTDGWDSWHLGSSEGPTLSDALNELNHAD